MAQMPIQFMSGRAESLPAAPPAAFLSRPAAAASRTAYLSGNAGISGGLLRPGAIDQEQFKAYLAAARQHAAASAPAPTRAPALSGVPTLSPAQLAALGAVAEPSAGELVIDIPAPNPPDPGKAGTGQPPYGEADGIAGGGGASAAPLFPAAPASADAAPADATPDAGMPVTGDTAHGEASTPEASSPATPAPAPQASTERGPVPGARRGADGVWEMTRLPDKDERAMLYGQKWRVVESERSRQLFLGPDGEFGWDDFVDMINPLQHIPLVNIAYRAITGDEIHGAARMVDFAFGPLAGVSTAVDLAFRDITGESMVDNAVAALFGPGDQPTGDLASINTASADHVQRADSGLIRRGSIR